MNKSRWMLVLACGVLVGGVGFGALAHVVTGGVAAQSTVEPRIGYVPDSATVVGYVDVQALASSPLTELLGSPEAAARRLVTLTLAGMRPPAVPARP